MASEMNFLSRALLILYCVQNLKKLNYRVGHTILQKLVYLLQSGKKMPVGYSFRLHYFGPYSESLWGDISSLDSMGLLGISGDAQGYGYDIRLTSSGINLLQKEESQKATAKFRGAIDPVARLLARRGAKQLELLGTTHLIYTTVYKLKGRVNLDEVGEILHKLKPHFPSEKAKEAVELLKSEGLLEGREK